MRFGIDSNAMTIGTRLSSLLVIAALGLSACTNGAQDENAAASVSVEPGADKQAFVEALSDMDETTLVMQSTAPQGAPTGRRFEEYAETVTEWSGGKIQFDITYSNGIAPPTEVDNAIADGRIDMGSVMPALEPSEFPKHAALTDVSFIGSQMPIRGLLEWHGAMFDLSAETDEFDQEFEEKGLKLLVPHFSSGSIFTQCSHESSSKRDFAGNVIATQSVVQREQVEALGMSSTSLSYAEMFEGLERGVVDCTLSNLTVASLQGLVEPAPYFGYDPEVGFGNAGGTFAINKQVWDDLPLAAQQLMFDRLEVFMTATLESSWENIAQAVSESENYGGAISPLDSDIKDGLQKVNENILEDIRTSAALSDPDAFVEEVLATEERWGDIISEMSIEGLESSYEELPEWYNQEAIDLGSYFEALYSGAWSERRPG